jgi:DNA-binding transcriptional LysR family regulator
MRVPGQQAGPATGTLLRREALVWCTSPRFHAARGAPWPLIALSANCSLRRVATTLLEKKGIAYVITHVASGVAGVLAATAAGLGVACLNASALESGGLTPLGARKLPALPEVAFRVLSPRQGERAVVGLARSSIVEAFKAATSAPTRRP